MLFPVDAQPTLSMLDSAPNRFYFIFGCQVIVYDSKDWFSFLLQHVDPTRMHFRCREVRVMLH